MKHYIENKRDGGHTIFFNLPFETPSGSALYRSTFKRLLDITLVILAAPTALPIVLFLAVLVAMDGKNPFYSQIRIGQGGRRFRIWKLRSMVANADQMLNAYLDENPEAAREWAASQKLVKDPRITRIGRLIRKTSLDELPQLWNVLNGTMSLVGPRPMMDSQEDLYTGHRYYNLRPGITGPWQVSDRHTSEFIARVQYDDQYDKNLSFQTDVKLLFKTVAVVIRCTGS